VRRLAAALLAAFGLALAGCGGESTDGGTTATPPPAASPSAAAQPFQLYTRCGVTFAQFAGQTWYADPPLSDGQGNPPPGFGNPTDRGSIRQVSAHELQYVSSGGKTVKFVDHLPAGASPPGLCS
jgi:hypothetical protein